MKGLFPDEPRRGLIVDLFAGGGGASLGITAATGLEPDIAINHDPLALAVHEANHPWTRHLAADVWEVDPRSATHGRPVWLLWSSPDCTHHSRAKGGKPRESGRRSLADVVVRWAREVQPEVIFLENVQEFAEWGALDDAGNPIPERKGEEFDRWVGEIRAEGYEIEWRTLDASHYGAPTSRRRLFLVARRDGAPIHWPERTHGGPGQPPLRASWECIDWSLPCPSIFLSAAEAKAQGLRCKRPLAEKTLARIAEGVKRFVIEAENPFIVPGGNAAAAMIQHGYGERRGQSPRVIDMAGPLNTITAGGTKAAVVAAFLAKHYGGVYGQSLERPTGTITATDHHALTVAAMAKFRGTSDAHKGAADLRGPMQTISAGGVHFAEVRAFLAKYYGSAVGQSLHESLHTATAKARFGLVTVAGEDFQIIDIGMRMLEPRELLAAQFGSFAARYDMSAATSKSAQVRLIGNSVCPEVARALVLANVGAAVAAGAVA